MRSVNDDTSNIHLHLCSDFSKIMCKTKNAVFQIVVPALGENLLC